MKQYFLIFKHFIKYLIMERREHNQHQIKQRIDSQRFNKDHQSIYNNQPSSQGQASSPKQKLVPSRIGELIIQIGPNGKKYLMNSSRQQSIILPQRNKFFRQSPTSPKPNDIVKAHNSDVKHATWKQIYHKNWQIRPQSKIYNYEVLQIQLLSQLYKQQMKQQERKPIEEQFFKIRGDCFSYKFKVLALFCSYYFTFRRPWMKLTRKNEFWFAGLSYFGFQYFISKIKYDNYIFTSILQNSKVYERIIDQYQNDYSIDTL